jgi:hypothetical protein
MEPPLQSYYLRNRESILAKTKERYYARTPEQRDADRIRNTATKKRLRNAPTVKEPGPVVFNVGSAAMNPFE